jgi:hypothetical protein
MGGRAVQNATLFLYAYCVRYHYVAVDMRLDRVWPRADRGSLRHLEVRKRRAGYCVTLCVSLMIGPN